MDIKFPVIAIGASAGGLEPLEQFFENTTNRSAYAYVIIQHLAPNHKSMMDELLSRHTQLPIHIIEDSMTIQKGNIYLNPPKKFVELKSGKFILSEKEDRKLSFPISSFFVSLAENLQEMACAIVFSGTGSDGSEGIKYIKEKAGLVLVQDPSQAKFNGMPNMAINSGVVDKICAVEKMHQEIDTFFANKNIINKKNENSATDGATVSNILNRVNKQINVDFTGYKHTTLLRRIHRRMSLLDYVEIEDYYNYLKSNPGEAHLLAKEFLIGVTRFFRDEEAFEILKLQVIPKLVEENMDSKTIRVWVPACSTGEEAYSIAILILDYLRIHKLQFDVNIFATDLDKEAIKFAANRIFSENIRAEIPIEYLNTYFIPQKTGYTVVKQIRDMIIFSAHNVIQDPPFNKIDLISCRNFLIYLNDAVQQQLFSLFQYSLRTNGFLFLGPSESLGTVIEEFFEFNNKHKIFINKENKKSIHRLHATNSTFKRTTESSDKPISNIRPVSTNEGKILNEIQHALIQEYVPDSLVIDENFNLLHTTGKANRWLRIPSGEISSNILKMLPESFSLPLEVVAKKVLISGKPVVLTNIGIPSDLNFHFDSAEFTNIQVRKKELLAGIAHLFITFEPLVKGGPQNTNFESVNINTLSKEKINILERELRINRETLQTTIEELESSNEELQAANEELQSSNEELESVNEELYTVNAEYQQKNSELSASNDDLNNLIHSTEIALLFLDSNLNIRKFTPSIKKILDLVPHDIGRNISHFRGKIQLDNLIEHVETVLENLVVYESRIEDIKRREYLLKISPFKTQKNEIKGVILVFVDLTQANKLKRVIQISDKTLADLNSKHEGQKEIFELISNNLRDMVCIINKEGQIEYCSPSGAEITGYPLEKLYEFNLLNQIPNKSHKQLFKKAFAAIEENSEPGLIEFEFKKSKGNVRWQEASIKPIKQVDTKGYKYLLTIRDVHQRKLNEIEFQKISLIAEQTSSAVIITDTNGKITFTNDAFEKTTGYSQAEALGETPGRLLQGPESDPEIIKIMSESINERKNFDIDIINYNKVGDKYLINIKAEPLYDKADNYIGFFSIQNDITVEQEHINQVHKLNQTIKEQFQKLEEVNKSLEEFAYIVSHDLKTPLRNIRGLLAILNKKGNSLEENKRKEYFDIIISSSIELDKMINNLLEYARSGMSNEEVESVDLSKLLKEVFQQFEKDMNELNGELDYDLEVTKLHIYPILFKRLVTNLISNSIKYRSERNPQIKITCIDLLGKVIFSVSDNGIGIPQNQFENIFKIFKTIKPNEDSNGIGLSVCKKIVEFHGGKIWVDSTEGEGTTIKFEIPKKLN
ncbi:CheR family methyltransferase [Aquiflexum sp.]|uniref:CheR family methyltransferase n=1 Tax=Aquiflexum sp. TaxID=1872584 RepID=UPI0035930F86